MSFGENLQYLRKQKNITQEQLAEQLEVSRQSVSKWESAQSYPEMEKLLLICSMFHCNMDTLMQGDVSRDFVEDVHGYDAFMNRFDKMVTAGIALILLGVSVMGFLMGIGVDEEIAPVFFFIFLIVGVLILVVMGMQHTHFTEKHPHIEDFYTEEERENAYRKFTVRIAAGIGIILVGVLLFMVIGIRIDSMEADLVQIERLENMGLGIFMLILTAGVSVLVYGAMNKDKYNITNYNKEKSLSPEKRKRESLTGKICGCIMLAALIIYLVCRYTEIEWSASWLVFVIGALLCGAVSIILSKDEDSEGQ